MKKMCSVCKVATATVYAGGPKAGDWADYYCQSDIPTGFNVWDRYQSCRIQHDYDFLADRCVFTGKFADVCDCWVKQQ